MLYLMQANYKDIVKEYAFTDKMPYDENGFIYEWHGTKREDFEDVIGKMIDARSGIGLPKGYVPETFYFLWRGENIVGMFRFRHYLCPSLENGAGHIGYYIGQEYRGKGYAAKGLRLLLAETKESLVEDEYYIRAHKSNIASQKTVLKNGGYIHHSDDSNVYLRIKKVQ